MTRVCLVNPPFAAIRTPSLALTQLRSVLECELGERVTVEVHYLNLEIARLMGEERYELFASAAAGQASGLGEWVFRAAAFPEAPDRDEDYLQRYFPAQRSDSAKLRDAALAARAEAVPRLLELVGERELHRADVVGMTTMFFQTTACLAVAHEIRRREPGVVVVLGGANCESPMGEELVRHAPVVDFVVSGPGLVAFPRLVRHLADGELDRCHEVPGVFSQRNLADAAPSSPIAPELPIDTEVDLDYDSFLDDLQRTFPDLRPHLLFETSRGCWWGAKAHCTFCGLNGSTMAHRAMSPERALGQFERLFRYWPRAEYFECVDNLMPHSYLREVFPELSPPGGARIFYEVKASLTAAQMEMLAAAGVRRMQAGIESLSSDTLALMKKGTTAFQNVAFLMHCTRFDIEAIWNLLVGFPGEDESVYPRAIDDARRLVHLPPPTGAYTVRFDRYSPYHSRPGDFGLELRPYDFYELVFPFPASALDDFAYYFMDHALDADYATGVLRWIADLEAAVAGWTDRWAEGGTPPTLRFRDDDSGVVLDGRGEAPRRLDLGADGRRVLDALSSPRDAERLARRLATDGDAPTDRSLREWIERLRGHDLLFTEGHTMMSVVLPARADRAQPEPPLVPIDRSAYRATPGGPSPGSRP